MYLHLCSFGLGQTGGTRASASRTPNAWSAEMASAANLSICEPPRAVSRPVRASAGGEALSTIFPSMLVGAIFDDHRRYPISMYMSCQGPV